MCAFAFVAQAQVRKFHYVDGGYWVKVDLNKKECFASTMFRLRKYHV